MNWLLRLSGTILGPSSTIKFCFDSIRNVSYFLLCIDRSNQDSSPNVLFSRFPEVNYLISSLSVDTCLHMHCICDMTRFLFGNFENTSDLLSPEYLKSLKRILYLACRAHHFPRMDFSVRLFRKLFKSKMAIICFMILSVVLGRCGW